MRRCSSRNLPDTAQALDAMAYTTSTDIRPIWLPALPGDEDSAPEAPHKAAECILAWDAYAVAEVHEAPDAREGGELRAA